jgi:hypothetical protein
MPPTPIAYVPLVVPIILAAVANLILAAAIEGQGLSEIGGFLLVGVVAGQFGLLATWAVLGPWRLYAQWFVTLLVGLGLFLAFVAGIASVERHGFRSGNEFLQMILVLFALLVAAQVPLWCIRLLRGWRLVLRGTDAARTAFESRQLQIRDLLIAMTILAVFLGTVSLVAKRSDGRDGAGDLVEVLIGCGVAVVWSALVLPICLWACFGASAIGVRIVALTGYLITVATIAMGVVLAVSGGRAASLEGLFFFLLLHVGLLAAVLSGLGLARACGYVLVSVRTARRRLAPLDGGKAAAGL